MSDAIKIEQLCSQFNQMMHQYEMLEKQIQTYEIDTPLHLSDTHTIVAIGKHRDINIVNLAKLQGITRSAVSQMVGKLVKRGFVKKAVSPETNNEVVLSLTEKGNIVLRAHEKQHQWLRGKLAAVLEKYPEDTVDTLLKIGIEIQEIWKEVPKER